MHSRKSTREKVQRGTTHSRINYQFNDTPNVLFTGNHPVTFLRWNRSICVSICKALFSSLFSAANLIAHLNPLHTQWDRGWGGCHIVSYTLINNPFATSTVWLLRILPLYYISFALRVTYQPFCCPNLVAHLHRNKRSLYQCTPPPPPPEISLKGGNGEVGRCGNTLMYTPELHTVCALRLTAIDLLCTVLCTISWMKCNLCKLIAS